MKGLKKFRQDNNISAWVMGRFTGLTMSDYLKFEKMKDEDIPTRVKECIQNIIDNKNDIANYYDSLEKFYMNNNLDDVFKDAGLSYEDIATSTAMSISGVKDILEEGRPFPDDNIKDMLIDFAMFIKNSNKQEPKIEEVEDEVEEEVQSPEMPSQDECMNNNLEECEEIAGLTKQVEWYEDLLTCFTHLAELAYRNNQ